jgi:hypothetical protein
MGRRHELHFVLLPYDVSVGSRGPRKRHIFSQNQITALCLQGEGSPICLLAVKLKCMCQPGSIHSQLLSAASTVELLKETTVSATVPELHEISDSLFDDQHEPPEQSARQFQLIIQIGRVLAICATARSLHSSSYCLSLSRLATSWSRIYEQLFECARSLADYLGSRTGSRVAKAEVL